MYLILLLVAMVMTKFLSFQYFSTQQSKVKNSEISIIPFTRFDHKRESRFPFGGSLNLDFRGVNGLTDIHETDAKWLLKEAFSITYGVESDLYSPGEIINSATKTPIHHLWVNVVRHLTSFGPARSEFDSCGFSDDSEFVSSRTVRNFEGADSSHC